MILLNFTFLRTQTSLSDDMSIPFQFKSLRSKILDLLTFPKEEIRVPNKIHSTILGILTAHTTEYGH